MKVLISLIFCLICFVSPITVSAEVTENDGVLNELKSELIDESYFEMDREVKEKLENYDIGDYEKQLRNLKVDNIFNEILSTFKSGFKKPFAYAFSLISVLIICSVVLQLKSDSRQLELVVMLSVVTFAVIPASSVISALNDAIKSAAAFFSSFIPIFAGVVAARGRALTSSMMCGTMLIICQCVSSVASYVVVPLTGMQLSLNIGSSFLKDVNVCSITKSITKCAMWLLASVSTVFLGVLGLQSVITAPADNLSIKTLKFVAGSAVPIVGNVISETIGTVSGCLKVLSSSAAIYAVAAVVIIFLPVIADIILWKFALFLSRCAAELLSLKNAAVLVQSAESCFSLILGVSLLGLVLFIISVTLIALV